jgi:hypothetical protein
MDMVVYETEHVHADTVCVGAVGQSQQEPLVVMVVGEDFHPSVASAGDVIYCAGNLTRSFPAMIECEQESDDSVNR